MDTSGYNLYPGYRCKRGITVHPVSEVGMHRKCTKVKGSLHKVQNTFVCSRCLNAVVIRAKDSVDIGGGASIELVDRFCYLEDMLSVDGSADVDVTAMIRSYWNKFRQLSA